MIANRHRVAKSMWSKWTEDARILFNAIYEAMGDQMLFAHPEAPQLSGKHWDTTRWNAAWWAAAELSAMQKSVSFDKMAA